MGTQCLDNIIVVPQSAYELPDYTGNHRGFGFLCLDLLDRVENDVRGDWVGGIIASSNEIFLVFVCGQALNVIAQGDLKS